MNEKTTAEIIVDKLIAWKIEVVFGMVGDGVNPVIEALRKNKDRIRLISVRHEEAAAFMAGGYSKYTGRLSACIATSGPGAVHLMNGLYDAAMENVPVLAITGSPVRYLLGTNYIQEVDTVMLMKGVTVYNQMINSPRHAMIITDIACRAALSTPGVSHLTVSTDVQKEVLKDKKTDEPSEYFYGTSVFSKSVKVPDNENIDQAAALINSGERIMVLLGKGALTARHEVEQLADKLGAPVAKALLGKSVLPDDSPFTTGGIGHLGTEPTREMMKECDTLIILGSNMPYLEYYPEYGKIKSIQIDRDPLHIGLRYPVDLGLEGDVKATLQLLLPKLQKKAKKDFLILAQKRMQDWRKKLEMLENENAVPIRPQFLVSVVSRLLTDNALIAVDTGAHTIFTARHLQIREKQQLVVSGNLATMGPALSYAIAGQIAFPGRQSVVLTGDGGFTMLMGELATAVKYNLPVKIILFKNNSLSMDEYEQQRSGNKAYGTDLQPIDFVKIAEGLGARGYSCSDPTRLETELRGMFATDLPSLIEVLVDSAEFPVDPEEV